MARRKNHPGSIDKRRETYRLRMSVGGRTHCFHLRGVTRPEAEQFAREKHRELLRQHQRAALGLTIGMQFSELLSLYRGDYLPTLAPGTQRAYEESLKPIGHYFLNELRDARLIPWRRHEHARSRINPAALWRPDRVAAVTNSWPRQECRLMGWRL